MSLIHMENLTKVYNMNKPAQVNALNGIDLVVNRGDFISIVGRSGAGKSTLMHIIGLIDRPSTGNYLFDGIDVRRMSDGKLSELRNEKVGIVLQDFGLIEKRSAYDNVAIPLMFGKTKYTHIHKKCSEAFEKLGIQDLMKRKVNQLSGGQKQRVAIARAIVNNPDIILADEPTGALDSKTSEEIMSVFGQLNRMGTTVVIITHDNYVSGVCSKKIEIADGIIK